MSGSPHISVNNLKAILVVGGGHGIGLALVKKLVNDCPDAQIHATYRARGKADELFNLAEKNTNRVTVHRLDAGVEADFALLAKNILTHSGHLSLAFNCIGYLHDSHYSPEKQLSAVDPIHVIESFRVNSIPTLLLAKHLKPLFKSEGPSIFVSLSARVGSIGDNGSGGWYSYRASKAALNMFIKNIALEYDRYSCNTVVVAVHPGTTTTELSEPFIVNSRYKIHTPEQTAANLLSVVADLSAQDNGAFVDWEGKHVPW